MLGDRKQSPRLLIPHLAANGRQPRSLLQHLALNHEIHVLAHGSQVRDEQGPRHAAEPPKVLARQRGRGHGRAHVVDHGDGAAVHVAHAVRVGGRRLHLEDGRRLAWRRGRAHDGDVLAHKFFVESLKEWGKSEREGCSVRSWPSYKNERVADVLPTN